MEVTEVELLGSDSFIFGVLKDGQSLTIHEGGQTGNSPWRQGQALR